MLCLTTSMLIDLQFVQTIEQLPLFSIPYSLPPHPAFKQKGPSSKPGPSHPIHPLIAALAAQASLR